MLRRKPTRIELRQEDRDQVDEMRKANKAAAPKPMEHVQEKEGSTRARIGL